jgi:hypothetical protein
MALSDDLRRRLAGAVVEGHVAQRGGEAIWGQHRQRRALVFRV